VEFYCVERTKEGKLKETGEVSPVYGGRWDTEAFCHVPDPEDLQVLRLPCSEPQLRAILTDKPKAELSGGRGGGKSEGGALRCLRYIAERPYENGRVISPTMDLVEVVRSKLISMIPSHWLLPGKEGVRLGPQPLLRFVHGVVVQFRSTNNPDSLRSWGGGWTHVDEAQDVSTYALDVAWPCLRETPEPRLWMTLTPKPGEPFDRHKVYIESQEVCECIAFSSYTNPFVSPKVHEISQQDGGMSKRTYKIEVEADWDTVAEIASEEELKPVFPSFNRAVHKWRPSGTDFGADITNRLIAKSGKVGQMARFSWKYIAGVDPNKSVPNYCTIWKVYRGISGGAPRWVAWDIIWSKGHCGHLARVLKDNGYHPRETLIIPDFSARYNKLGMLKAAMQLMREEGYYVVNRPKNPKRKNSIEDVESKLDPAKGPPLMFFRLPQCDVLADNLESVVWDKMGNGFDKSVRPDPVDSARYPVSFFSPAQRAPRVRGISVG